MISLGDFTQVLVPLFVAMSPLTALPMFLSLTEGMPEPRMRSLSRRAVLTGFTVAVAVVLLGQALFRFLGITIDDLRVAGGIILLLISVHDLIYTRETRKQSDLDTDDSDIGVVPLGVPLIVGPATLTACVVLADSYGRTPVVLALAANLLLIGFLLHYAQGAQRVVPEGASKAFGKVMSLFLAAIAVSMLRTGIFSFIEGG